MVRVTDDERRDVARRLREVEGYAIPDRRFADHPITGEVIAAAVMYDLPDVKGLLGRLADLIEPSCDREALLALAKVLHDMGNQYDAHNRYELGTTFTSIAARIREALGVQDA